ncbi:glycosyltransferase [Hydrogenophaga sp. PAMC20947]|uniref:glycosyltransferase n=1 Tax=Hydrogenophaga sp. PAMC20947 TaxID=2565558 RepID=UPI00109DD487|nr:glycosyltransferase [Hydrogenophaga sp. PAMC20947]QCB48720.1 glycosyltransferase [Hydrogenophaga sp. PAMC20947]
MIARDEARCIQRCLRSAAPYVDRMLVLDTGSRDDTVALAQACGAEIQHMEWPGSFALARNKALVLANADWNLILDADEWIVSGGECLRETVHQTAGLGTIRVESSCGGAANPGVGVDWLTRWLPRGVRYIGAVHEQPESALPRHRMALVVGHDGYEPDAMVAKKGRNQALLQAMLVQAGGDDAYLLFQLGKDFEAYGELEEAANLYLRSLGAARPIANSRTSLIVRTLHCLGKSGRLQKALAMAGDFLAELADSPDYFFTVGDLCLDAAVACPQDAAAEWLPMAKAAWERCLEIGERAEQDGSVLGRGSYLAAHNLSVVHGGLGEAGEAARYLQMSGHMRAAADGFSARPN